MSQLYDKKKFFFTYNKIKNKNLNLGYDIKNFYQGHEVVVEFMTYAINFRTVLKLDLILNYNFKLQNLYFIKGKRTIIFTQSKRKRKPDKWLVLLPHISKTNFYTNLLNLSVNNSNWS